MSPDAITPLQVYTDGANENWKLYHADVLAGLNAMEPDSVHCVMTSPPYWGLRDYGMPGQIGLEATVEDWVAQMVAVFEEVRRVLRDDGTLWLNLGDCYNTQAGKVGECPGGGEQGKNWAGFGPTQSPNRFAQKGLKPKDLIGMPWRVAFALQAAGWYLRSDIIWSKPNPMPESVTDRPTKAHEYLFLFAKSEHYYYDSEAIRIQASEATFARLSQPNFESQKGGPKDPGDGNRSHRKALNNLGKRFRGHPREHSGFMEWDGWTKEEQQRYGANKRTVWEVATRPYPDAHFATFPPALVEPCIRAGTSSRGVCSKCGTPWFRITSSEYSNDMTTDGRPSRGNDTRGSRDQGVRTMASNTRMRKLTGTLGWCPDCRCDGTPIPTPPTGHAPTDRAKREAWEFTQVPKWRRYYACVQVKVERALETVPALVLDPFAGTATTGQVALENGRRFVGIELNIKSIRLAEKRLGKTDLQEHLIP